MKKISFILRCLCFSCALLFAADQTLAQASEETNASTHKISADHITDPPIKLTPDKSELIRLDQDAAAVIVGNPSHASVLTENNRLLVVVPQQPGATHFTVLDKDGKVIMQRHVIVASPKERYLRVRRNCAGVASPAETDVGDCRPTRVYYCEDMCHEIAVSEEEGDGGQQEGGGTVDATEAENALTGNN